MKNKKIIPIAIIGILIVIVSIFYYQSNKPPENMPEGYAQFNNSSVPYKFFYPEGMNIGFNDSNDNHPIITVTTPDDPTYYYAITGSDNNTMEQHFQEVNTDITNELLTLTEGMVMDTADFFETKAKVDQINGTEAEIIEFVSLDMELTPFSGALYKINSVEDSNFTYVVFVSSPIDSEADILLNSLTLK